MFTPYPYTWSFAPNAVAPFLGGFLFCPYFCHNKIYKSLVVGLHQSQCFFLHRPPLQQRVSESSPEHPAPEYFRLSFVIYYRQHLTRPFSVAFLFPLAQLIVRCPALLFPPEDSCGAHFLKETDCPVRPLFVLKRCQLFKDGFFIRHPLPPRTCGTASGTCPDPHIPSRTHRLSRMECRRNLF